MGRLLKPFERVLALVGLCVIAGVALLHQTSDGAVTPCHALYVQARPHLGPMSKDVVETCLGARGEAGPVGLVLELGLAVTGQSRDKLSRRVSDRLDEQMRASLLGRGEGRCAVILMEGLVGRAHGGPQQYAQDLADGHKADCRGEERR